MVAGGLLSRDADGVHSVVTSSDHAAHARKVRSPSPTFAHSLLLSAALASQLAAASLPLHRQC